MENKKSRFFAWTTANWDVISTIGKLLFVAFGGAVSGYVVWITDKFNEYSPASWFFAALIGAALSTLILGAISWFRAERIRATYLKMAPQTSIEFNPLEDQVIRKRIFVSDLLTPLGEPILNKTFIKCEIVGPGAIFFAGAHFHSPHLGNCEAIKMQGDAAQIFPNKVIFTDCTFRDCKFYNLVIIVPSNLYESFNNIMKNVVKWL